MSVRSFRIDASDWRGGCVIASAGRGCEAGLVHERGTHPGELRAGRGIIAEAARRSGRTAESVRLVAVTKRSPPEWIRPLVACGARDLGENYPQELWRKAESLADLGDSVRWHLIGHLQSNKVKKTLPLVRMIHAVDSLKLLRILDEAARALPTRRRSACR